MNEQQFAVSISFMQPYVDENDTVKTRLRTLVLDAVSDTTIQASNTITEHPIVSGDYVADHSYKNPATLSLSGAAAEKGHKGIVVDSSTIKLADLQQLFMEMKNNAYLCSIVKIVTTNEEDVRFSTWTNMVIDNVTMTERVNTLQYTLSFRQVLLAQVQEADVDVDDAFLPNIYEPQASSFTDALIDWEQIDKIVFDYMYSIELITSEFAQYLSSLTAAALTGIFVGFVASAIIVKALTTFAIASSAAGPVGWVITAVVATAIFAYGLIKALSRVAKAKKYRIQQFQYYKDDNENKKEVERFGNFIGEIHTQLEKLNNVIHCYQISSDDDQECVLTIDNNYYTFTFTRNNTDGSHMCNIIDINETSVGSLQKIESAPSNYNACTSDNYLFRAAESGAYVYIVNPSTSDDFKLSNCFIVVSDIDPADYNSAVEDIIKNALTY